MLRKHCNNYTFSLYPYSCCFNGFSLKVLLSWTQQFGFACLQYSDYALRVLLAEVAIKIVMDLRNLEYEEAENFFQQSWLVLNKCMIMQLNC